VAELFTARPAGAGAALEARAETFLGVASGSGVEVPDWLERLGAAVDRAIEAAEARGDAPHGAEVDPGRLPDAVPCLAVPWETLHAALALDRGGRG
jgi:5-enolpyruvylshikimate-3-phosphate synthase